MLVQLNKCVVVSGSDLQRGHSGDGCLTASILFKYERSMGHLFVPSWARVRWVALGVMYCEWYGVCDFVVLSVVEVCADYGGVAPNDTAYKRWSCHSGFKLLCKLCRTFPSPSNGGPIYRFLGMRTRWMAGAAAHKSG